MQLKNKKIWVCDNCGEKTADPSTFNQADRERGDYCMKCHPKRMTYMQLIEWLAKGNGFMCQQVLGYTTAPAFSLSPVEINGRSYPGKSDDQIPYNEHELVVRYFDGEHPRHKKAYWLIPTEEMFLEDC